ncbi:hypothetical protein EDD11_003945 [Mortierella claussenii]|nr:hypothetical protein EDD11_003945 [Mortierella claussenii]
MQFADIRHNEKNRPSFFAGRYVQEPLDIKLGNISTSPPTSKSHSAHKEHLRDRQQTILRQQDLPSASTRPATQSLNSSLTTGNSLYSLPGSRSHSPDIDEINWSPKKTKSAPSTDRPGAFGIYREPGQSTVQNDPFLSGPSRPVSAPLAQDQRPIYNGFGVSNSDTKFHSRAYEPSPLANPSIITNMGLNNMSLGEMFGFPSAKFQPPENHFAHRSVKDQRMLETDAWSFRRSTAETGHLRRDQGLTHRHRALPRSRFVENADVDMDDGGMDMGSGLDLDDDSFFTSTNRLSNAQDTSSHSWDSGERDAFAAQRYFPPEPETGLEDNFFGIVKIVDDYLPPQAGPRSIVGRNLMLKKRMARRWLALIVLCRCNAIWKTLEGEWSILDWISQAVFVGVMLHVATFWALDEYRTMRRHLDRNTASTGKIKPSATPDPFEPMVLDDVCSLVSLTFGRVDSI